MGFTRYFYTHKRNLKLMTLDEVKAGVIAIKTVAERPADEFRIDHLSETAITVNVRSNNPVESLMFAPTEGEEGFFQRFTFCKTNECLEDEGVKEMLDALQLAVHNKLYMSHG